MQQGAIATLFDATWLAYIDESALNSIPPSVVYLSSSELNLLPFGIFALGHHFFDSTGAPVFNLSSVDKILYGAKIADIKAPVTANKGPAGTGAADWLELIAKEGYNSKGLSLVYRVVTAGGEPLNCTVGGTMTVDYAAEYWFYD